ncbi:hypothetical protein [Actinokineospora alba]|uniref:hypothetical protein n=1 Tax=Actinokineospora alba TaxID=504798 RepID=UPI000B8594DC|nr:hypothetical protein [Actinokineospora alba]
MNDSHRVTVRGAEKAASSGVTAELPGTGRINISSTMIGTVMVADLSSPYRRTLLTDSFAEWARDVRPTRSGSLKLDLVIKVVDLTREGASTYYKTYDQPVEVEVNLAYGITNWLKTYWPMTGLTIPVLGAAGWTLWRNRRRAVAGVPANETDPGEPPASPDR